MDTPEEPLQVTIKQAAQRLRYSERTIYTLLKAGEIRSVGRGRLRRIPLDELRRWQERNMN